MHARGPGTALWDQRLSSGYVTVGGGGFWEGPPHTPAELPEKEAPLSSPQPLGRRGCWDSLKCDPFLCAASPGKEAASPLGGKGITASQHHDST